VRRLLLAAVFALALGAGLGVALRLGAPRPAPLPDPPSVVTAVREMARLETLEVRLWKKVSFAPEPEPAGSFWGDLRGWIRHTVNPPRGRAIVFADARVGLDLGRLDGSSLRVVGREVWVVLPPLRTTVELRPGDTEIIGSNLDSAETAKLLQLAKDAFEREVGADRALAERARGSAERAIRGLVLGLGFSAVRFVDVLPAGASPS
jgi:hypothetical protein